MAKVKHPFICKFCRVPVVSEFNHHPLLGYSHGKKCPRRRSCN